MKLTGAACHGLIAAAYIAKHTDEGRVSSTKISEEYGIIPECLLKILQQMVRVNILRSRRGVGGGYTLARPAKEITLLEIIEAVDGPISTQLELVQVAKKAPYSVKMEKVCVRASEKTVSILSRAKLSQMVR